MPSLSTALPFGMRDVKIYPYTDAQGTILAATGYDLPYAQTFSFADTEDFTDLRGDDVLVATHGQGAQVNWSLESGGISLQCWAVFTGGAIIETGVTPNRVVTLRKLSDDVRPYFKVVGQIISENGGDVTGHVFRAKCNGDINGQFGDGQFFVTSADGIGLPVPGTNLLYEIRQHETRVSLPTSSEANPILPPRNLSLTALGATTASFAWDAVTGATGYKVRTSANGGTTWVTATDPTNPTIDITDLTTNTDYIAQVATKVGASVSDYSASLAFHTL